MCETRDSIDLSARNWSILQPNFVPTEFLSIRFDSLAFNKDKPGRIIHVSPILNCPFYLLLQHNGNYGVKGHRHHWWRRDVTSFGWVPRRRRREDISVCLYATLLEKAQANYGCYIGVTCLILPFRMVSVPHYKNQSSIHLHVKNKCFSNFLINAPCWQLQ